MRTAVVIAGALCVGACGAPASSEPDPESPGYAVDVLTEAIRNSGGAKAFGPAAVTQALPNVRFSDGTHHIRLSTLVAAGRFGTVVHRSATSPGFTVPFTMTRPIAAASSTQGAPAGAPVPVSFTLSQDIRPGAFARSLAGMGDVVVFLNGSSDEWTLTEDVLLGRLAADGRILFPVDHTGAGAGATNGIAVDVDTIAGLQRSSRQPRVVRFGPAAAKHSR